MKYFGIMVILLTSGVLAATGGIAEEANSDITKNLHGSHSMTCVFLKTNKHSSESPQWFKIDDEGNKREIESATPRYNQTFNNDKDNTKIFTTLEISDLTMGDGGQYECQYQAENRSLFKLTVNNWYLHSITEFGDNREILTFERFAEIKNDAWLCSEIGLVNTERPDEDQEIKYTHHIRGDKLYQYVGNEESYNSQDLVNIIDRKKGDQYTEYPMECVNNVTRDILKFYEHPHVLKSFYDGNQDHASKSESVSFSMTCQVFRPDGYTHRTNFTWEWYKTNPEGEWSKMEITEDNSLYTQTFGYSSGINYNATLKLLDLDMQDEARYKCNAGNGNGNHEHVFELTIISKSKLLFPFCVMSILVIIFSVLVFVYERFKRKKQENEFDKQNYGHTIDA